MSVAGAPELLVELLTEAARTPGGQVGLLRAAQVAQVLGRHRDWVQAHATQLGGFRLFDSGMALCAARRRLSVHAAVSRFAG